MRLAEIEDGQLTGQTHRSSTDQWQALLQAHTVDHAPGLEIVGAIQDHLSLWERPSRHGGEVKIRRFRAARRIMLLQGPGGHAGLVLADMARLKQDLAMQVGRFHPVAIHQHQPTDAHGGQIERGRAPEASHADDRHSALLQALLPGAAPTRQPQLSAVDGQ